MSKDTEYNWVEFLGAEGESKIFVRCVFSENFGGIEEFAVVYLAAINEKDYEVIRYDCSTNEAIHAHKFFCKPQYKTYLQKEKTIETLKEFITDIRKNWMLYKAKFVGNYLFL